MNSKQDYNYRWNGGGNPGFLPRSKPFIAWVGPWVPPPMSSGEKNDFFDPRLATGFCNQVVRFVCPTKWDMAWLWLLISYEQFLRILQVSRIFWGSRSIAYGYQHENQFILGFWMSNSLSVESIESWCLGCRHRLIAQFLSVCSARRNPWAHFAIIVNGTHYNKNTQ